MNLSRRRFFLGAAAVVAAPAIIRVASLMPVRAMPDHAALEALMRKRLNAFVDQWHAQLFADGSSDPLGGIAALIEESPRPEAIIVGKGIYREYQRYTWREYKIGWTKPCRSTPQT